MIKKILIKLKDLLFKDIIWKLVSLFFSIALWFVVVNESNPTSTMQYTLNLSIDNPDYITESNYVLLNEEGLRNTVVDIYLRSSRNDFAELNKREDEMRAYIDFRPIDISKTSNTGEPQPITVKFSLPDNLLLNRYELLNVNPMTVDVILDRSITKTFTITVDKIGEAADGYVLLQPELEPETVRITGPQSVIGNISAVKAEVNVAGVSESVLTTQNITVFDETGKDITNERLKFATSEVEVSIPVNKYAKIEIKEPEVYGTLLPGYHVTSVDWSPKTVEIVGNEEDVDEIESIELAPISVEGLDMTFSEVYDLRNNILAVKSNCNIRNGTPHEVTVTVTIENEVEKQIALLPENIIRLGAPAEYTLGDEEIILTVTGLKSTLDGITERYVSAIIDLTGLSVGVHEVQSQIYLPIGVKLVGEEPKIRVTIPVQSKEVSSSAVIRKGRTTE